jgi:hypothetical protein
MRRSLPSAVAALLVGALAACSHENDARDDRSEPAEPEPSYSAIPVPPRPMTGTLDAVLKQSSRDAARNRMQVWIFNGTEEDVEPTGIRYVDPRLSRPIAGERLRSMPSGLERGFPLPLPEPRCGGYTKEAPVVTVETGDGTESLTVEDSIGIVQRYYDATCFERAVREVVDLEWDDTVPSDGDVGTMTLIATPTGKPGRLEITRVGATPVLKEPTTTTWQPDRVVEGDGPPQRIDLPVVPARCDRHAFFEAGGATAFRLRLRLDGEVGELVLRMSPTGAEAAIAYAINACGLDD